LLNWEEKEELRARRLKENAPPDPDEGAGLRGEEGTGFTRLVKAMLSYFTRD